MHRLTEHQIVTLCPPPETPRVGAFDAYVVAIDGPVVSLHAAQASDVHAMPSKLGEVMLTFEHRGLMVALSGELRFQASSEDLRFRVGDRFYIPRQRSSPLAVCTPVALTPSGGPAGAEVAAQTQELAPDGLLLEPSPAIPHGIYDVAVTLPGDPAPVRARGVVRGAEPRVEFIGIAPVERRRIRAFVANHLRERLKLVRAYQEFDDESF